MRDSEEKGCASGLQRREALYCPVVLKPGLGAELTRLDCVPTLVWMQGTRSRTCAVGGSRKVEITAPWWAELDATGRSVRKLTWSG